VVWVASGTGLHGRQLDIQRPEACSFRLLLPKQFELLAIPLSNLGETAIHSFHKRRAARDRLPGNLPVSPRSRPAALGGSLCYSPGRQHPGCIEHGIHRQNRRACLHVCIYRRALLLALVSKPFACRSRICRCRIARHARHEDHVICLRSNARGRVRRSSHRHVRRGAEEVLGSGPDAWPFRTPARKRKKPGRSS